MAESETCGYQGDADLYEFFTMTPESNSDGALEIRMLIKQKRQFIFKQYRTSRFFKCSLAAT